MLLSHISFFLNTSVPWFSLVYTLNPMLKDIQFELRIELTDIIIYRIVYLFYVT